MEQKKQILVTDDEPMVTDSFRIMLKDDYEVLTAYSGKDCLEIVERQKPHLVILDVRLPDMDGIEVLKEIKRIDVSLPVIVITGVGTHKTAIEALKLGADDFIAKPLNFYELRAIIANSLCTEKRSTDKMPSPEDVITRNYLSTLKVLNRILGARDPYTRRHSQKVSEYAVRIARELGLSQDEQEVMKEAALLHDIGKVGVAEAILNKPDKLNAQEWAEVKRHTQIGEGFLQPVQVLHIEQSMIRHHHERYDGKGYPDHLKGEEIPLYARILAVADAYEAMTSPRPYRQPLSPIDAVRELEKCSGTQFDPKIVKVFIGILKKEEVC